MTVRFTPEGFELDGQARRFVCGLIPFTHLPPDRWDMALDRARELGLSGVALDLVWRTHERSPGRLDLGGARGLGRFLARVRAHGLWAAVRLGPFFPAEQGLGLPERVLADPACQARDDAGRPRWLPVPWRLVPVPALGSPALLSALLGWFGAAAEALAREAHPAGPVLALGLDLGAADPFGAPAAGELLDAAARLGACLRSRLPGLPVLHGLPAWMPPDSARVLAGLADGLGAPLDLGRPELAQIAARAARIVDAGAGARPLLGLPLAAGCPIFGRPRGLDDQVFCALAGLMHGMNGFVLETLVGRPGWTGAPVRPDLSLDAERADWVRRTLRLLERLSAWRPRGSGLGVPGGPDLAWAWHGPQALPDGQRPDELGGLGPGCLWLANPAPGPRRARLRLGGARLFDLWRQREFGGAEGDLELAPFSLRPLEVRR
ncbi:MAG TPA: beta-galactosidase [Myxococcota bacterium]|nr:beta-galactosidase [Myxococcota bacterium]HRY92789.1 beta-galactosidase [Myxococcota bacterium]HSA19835.1 beta-galactosidase [Myxococcota bacterium]